MQNTVAPPTSSPRFQGNRLTLATLVMSWVFLGGIIGTGLVGPNRPAIEREFGLSHTLFGVGLAAIQVLAATAMLTVSGRLKRYPSMAVLTGALGVQAVGFTTVVLSRGIVGLVAGWALVILGSVAGAVTNNISMRLWEENPRKGVTLLHAFNSLGKVAGPLLVAACLLAGWRMGFLVCGVITCVLGACYFAARSSVAGEAPAVQTASGRSAMAAPFFWVSLLPFALIAGGEAAFATLAPTFYMKVRGLDGSMAALLFTVHLCGLAAGRFLTAWVGQRFSSNAIIAACLTGGIFVIPAVVCTHPAIVAPSLFLLGFTFSSTWPTYYAQASQFHQQHIDLFAFGSSLANTIGLSTCTLFSSMIADHNLTLSLFFGPAVLWAFGAMYYASRLSRPAPTTGTA